MCVAENQISCVLQGAKGNFCVSPLENPHQHTHTHIHCHWSSINHSSADLSEVLPTHCRSIASLFLSIWQLFASALSSFRRKDLFPLLCIKPLPNPFFFPTVVGWVSDGLGIRKDARNNFLTLSVLIFSFPSVFYHRFGTIYYHAVLPLSVSGFKDKCRPFFFPLCLLRLFGKKVVSLLLRQLHCGVLGWKKGEQKTNVFDCHQGPPGNLGQNWDNDAWER